MTDPTIPQRVLFPELGGKPVVAPSTGSRRAPTAAPCCSRRPSGCTALVKGFARCLFGGCAAAGEFGLAAAEALALDDASCGGGAAHEEPHDERAAGGQRPGGMRTARTCAVPISLLVLIHALRRHLATQAVTELRYLLDDSA